MSARLLKGGPPSGAAFAPFTIPTRQDVGESMAEGEATPSAENRTPAQEAEEQARALLEVTQNEADRMLAEAQARVAQIEQVRQIVEEELETVWADKKPAKAPGSALFPAIADAPGAYVMEK